MTHYFIRAYLDKYDLIVAEVDRMFCKGQCDQFYLVNNAHVVPLNTIKKVEKSSFIEYHLAVEDIEIGNEYYIMGANAYRTPLVYRYVVKTKEFNEEFCYDDCDLGSSVVNDITTFKVWAPTATSVDLAINDKYYRMIRKDKGVHSLSFNRDLTGTAYTYLVKVNGEIHQTLDPYGKAGLADSAASVVCKSEPLAKVPMTQPRPICENIIYEASVRDFTPEGTFSAIADNSDYLVDLGITHLQLLPVGDYASVYEKQKGLYYNWGYDPVQYMTLEGSYSSDVNDPLRVVSDFKKMVGKLHYQGIRVNLDVVFNHHYCADRSSFNQLVPYYYFRYEKDGGFAEGSGCGAEFDTQMPMCRKYFIDVLTYFVKEYDIDGFRFDLMGFIDIETMKQMTDTLSDLKPNIMMYGEGWNMKAGIASEQLAHMDNYQKFPFVGFFNDIFRDVIKGSTFDREATGYGSGNSWMVEQAIDCLRSERFGDPSRSINYVECHDDMTCYDKLKVCCKDEDEGQIVERQKLILGCIILSQGVSFIHSGQECCLSKNGLANTYNGPEEKNHLTSEMVEKNEDVIEYVRELIKFKHSYHISGSENISFESFKGMIIYRVNDLIILINPTDDQIGYNFSGHRTILFDGSGVTYQSVENRLQVEPISIYVLGSDDND